MAYMSWSHIVRQRLDDPSVVDITGGQMILVIKLSAFAWNVHDGRLKPDLMTDSQKDRAIYQMPEFLDYAGYVFFFPSVWTGPAFDYVDYKRWLQTTMFEIPEGSKAPPTHANRRIPRSAPLPPRKPSLACCGLVSTFNSPAGTTLLYYFRTSIRRSPFSVVFGCYICLFTSRLKYYGVWTLTEGACILSGLGYNGLDPKTGKPLWNRLENVNAWEIETAQNSRAYLDGWNKNTNKWLRNYVYLRVTPKGKNLASEPLWPPSSLQPFGTASTRDITSHLQWVLSSRLLRKTSVAMFAHFSSFRMVQSRPSTKSTMTLPVISSLNWDFALLQLLSSS